MEAGADPHPDRPVVCVLVYLGLILLVSLLSGTLWGVVSGLEAPGTGGASTPFHLLAAGLLMVPAQLVVTHVFLRRHDRCGWRDLLAGPMPPRFEAGGAARGARGCERADISIRAQVAWGCVLGAGFLGLLLAVGSAAGWMRWAGWRPAASCGAPSAVQGALIAIAAAFLQGGGEEVVFRGYVMRSLARWRGLAAAVSGSALLFACVHGLNPGAGPVALLNVAVVGAFLGLLRARWSVGAAIGFHGVWNAGLILLSLPCSGMEFGGLASVDLVGPRAWTGGQFGPEASLLTTAVFAVGVFALALTLRRGAGRPRPACARARCDSAPGPPRPT